MCSTIVALAQLVDSLIGLCAILAVPVVCIVLIVVMYKGTK